MITLPLELEQQIQHLAAFEHTDTTTLLSRMVNVYQTVMANHEEKLFLSGVETSLAEEWDADEDEVNFRDL